MTGPMSNDFTYRYAIRRPDGELMRMPDSSSLFGNIFAVYVSKPRSKP